MRARGSGRTGRFLRGVIPLAALLVLALVVAAASGRIDLDALRDPSSWLAPAAADEAQATVVRVVDGDTLIADVDGERTRVRLLNIDAPELHHGTQAQECLGPEATAFLARRLPGGTTVTLAFDREREDRYGRTLAGVYEGDSLVNAEVAEAGLALPVLFEPNDRFYAAVVDASDDAERAGRGLFDPASGCGG